MLSQQIKDSVLPSLKLPLLAAWYSYSVGPVFFVAYSTEVDYSPGSAQYKYETSLLLIKLCMLTA